MRRDKEAWQSEGRKAAVEANTESLKAYEKAELEESRIKSEQTRAVRAV